MLGEGASPSVDQNRLPKGEVSVHWGHDMSRKPWRESQERELPPAGPLLQTWQSQLTQPAEGSRAKGRI